VIESVRFLLDAIVQCQHARLLPAGDPREIAGPTWTLLHGTATLTIGSDLNMSASTTIHRRF
jgi:hypothetical protein